MPSDRAPAVSVVIPTYNRAQDIPRCLESLAAQTFQDFEVLVCDDGSADATGEVVHRYQDRMKLTYKWSENFGGPARPRNIGIGLARGELIAFLDSDDWWLPRKLEESVKALEQGADLVYHDLYIVTRPDQRLFLRKSNSRSLGKPVFADLLVNGNALNNSSVVVRRKFLEAIGGFSEERDLIAAEDYDAWVRIGKLTDRFARIPQTLGYYWVGQGNISNPRRTVTLLNALEAKYAKEMNELRRDHSLHWSSYIKARCYYGLGMHEAAKEHLSLLGSGQVPLGVRAKKAWMLLIMGLHKALSRAP